MPLCDIVYEKVSNFSCFWGTLNWLEGTCTTDHSNVHHVSFKGRKWS